MSRWLRDITWNEKGALEIPAEALKQWHQLGAAVADTETTGLSQETSGITELVAIRAMTTQEAKKLGVKLNAKSAPGGIRLIAFQAHLLPQKPAMADYKAGSDYDRAQYEYDISPKALEVTGTDIVREKGRYDGPIKHLTVNGKAVASSARFDEVMNDYLAFTDNGAREVFFNAPFDKRMIGQKIVETEAYRLASADAHLTHASLPTKLRLPYAEANAQQRGAIRAWLSNSVHLPDAYRDPAQWRCLYHAFRAAHPNLSGHRLDDAVRHYVNADFAGRAEHSALEDVLLAGKTMLALAKRDYNDAAPDMNALWQTRLKQHVPSVTTTLVPSQHQGRHNIGFFYDADSPEASRLSHALESAERVRPSNPLLVGRNPLSPGYVINLSSTETHAHGAISTQGKHPRAYSALHQIEAVMSLPKHHGWLARLTPYDSLGSHIDVTVKHAHGQTIVQDVPWIALKANLTYLDAHPDQAEATLTMLRDVMLADERIGAPLIHVGEYNARELVLRGHVRGFGTLRLQWPAGYDAASFLRLIRPSLNYWVGHSIVPFTSAQMAKAALYDDTSYGSTLEGEALSKSPRDYIHVSQTPGGKVTVSVDALTYKLMQFSLPEEWLKHERSFTALRTQSGMIHAKKIPIEDAHTKRSYRMELTGPTSAFGDFVQSRPVTGQAAETVAERPSNMMRDAAWLAYRMRSIAGTYDVDVSLRGREIVLHQNDGVSPRALQMLMDTRCPFTATPRSIRIPARYLANDAFDYTLAFTRWQETMGDRPTSKHIASYATALHRGQAVRMQFAPELPLQFSLGDGSQLLLESYNNQGPTLQADVTGISRLQSDLDASSTVRINGSDTLELSAWQRALLECCLKENHYPLETLDTAHLTLAAISQNDGLREAVSEMLRRTSSLRSVLAPMAAPLNACELSDAHSARIRMHAISPCHFGDLLNDTTQFYANAHELGDKAPTTSLADGMRTLRRDITPLAESITKRRQTDPFELIAGHITPVLPALKTLVGTMSGESGALPEMIRAIGQTEFSGLYAQGGLNFSGRIAADITRLSRLQDMARSLADQPRTTTSEHDALLHYAQQCATVQSKLLTAHFALQRLQEASSTVTKKAVGSAQHASLMDAVSDYFEQSLPERLIHAHLAQPELSIDALLTAHDHDLRTHYGLPEIKKPEAMRALRTIGLLSHMPADDDARGALQSIATAFLGAAYPKLADHAATVIDSIANAPSDWHSYHTELFDLLSDLPPQTRRKLTDTITCIIYPAQLPAIEHEMIEQHAVAHQHIRQKHWEEYGRTFLKLQGHYRAQGNDDTTQLTELARRCFLQAGYSAEACEMRIAKQKPLTLKPHELARALDKLAQRKSGDRKQAGIPTPENWQSAYMRIERQIQQLEHKSALHCHDYLQRIRTQASHATYNPHRDLHHSRALMRSAKHLANEIDDAIKIYRHSMRDLSAAMLLLRSDPEVAATNSEHSIKPQQTAQQRRNFPEPRGISERLLPDIHDGARLMHTLMLSHAQQICDGYGIPARTDGDQLVFDPSQLLSGDAASKQLWHTIMASKLREQAFRETIIAPTPVPAQQRHIVFDSSALIPYLALSDANPPQDPFHAGVNLQKPRASLAHARLDYAMLPLTCLTPEAAHTGPGRKVDSLIFPDHVFYEVTGILAASQPQMLHEFALSIAANNFDALERSINHYVDASPRLNLAKSYQNDQENLAHPISRAQLRAELKCLVTYIAFHPQSLVKTKIGERYSSMLQSEYARITEPLENRALPTALYAPSMLDVMASGIEAARFAPVRIHVRQLVHMGWMSEAEYKKSMQFSETEQSQKKRFVQVDELLKRLNRSGALDDAHYTACSDAYKQIISASSKGPRKLDDNKYLTFGTLAALLPHMPESLRGAESHENMLENALELASHSKLLVEQYFYAGIFPRDYERPIAHALGMDAQISADTPTAIWQQQLKDAGFYERSIHMEDLQHIDAALADAGASAEQRAPIQQLLTALSHSNPQRSGLNNESMHRATNAEPSAATMGTPFEKMLSDAVINGAVSNDEFVRILAKLRPLEHGHLRAQPASLMKSWHGNIQLAQMDVDHTPYILIMRDGAAARMGSFTPEEPHTWPIIAHERMPGDVQDFIRIPLYEVIRRARDALEDKGAQQRYHRIIEALIFPIFSQENGKEHAATRLMGAMHEVLGEARSMQLFKDFQTRHMRKAWGSLQPNASVLMGAHIHARIERHNLGEASVLETCNTQIAAAPDSKVYAATHDHSLMHQPETGLTLDPAVRRQHSAYHLPAQSSAGILPTRQFAAWTDTELTGVSSKHALTPDFEQERVRTRGSR